MGNLCLDQVLEKVHYYLMPRYQILVEYAGSNFRGWQVQKKGKTVQGLIQEKISKLLKEKIIIYGAGRLDSGVHAEEQSAHFDYNIEIKKKDRFLQSINHFLRNENITILNLKKRDKNFHARFSAKMRIYKYIIINRISGPVLDKDKGWHVMKKLDLAKIQINENSKAFYTSEIKSDPDLREAYRTFDLLKLKSIEVVNYNYGNFDKVDTREKRRKLEADAAERKRNDEGNNLTN